MLGIPTLNLDYLRSENSTLNLGHPFLVAVYIKVHGRRKLSLFAHLPSFSSASSPILLMKHSFAGMRTYSGFRSEMETSTDISLVGELIQTLGLFIKRQPWWDCRNHSSVSHSNKSPFGVLEPFYGLCFFRELQLTQEAPIIFTYAKVQI